MSAVVKKRLYTISEAAVYLGRSVWSVRRLIWAGVLPAVRVHGRIHLDVADMDELITRSKHVEEAPTYMKKGVKVGYGIVSAQK